AFLAFRHKEGAPVIGAPSLANFSSRVFPDDPHTFSDLVPITPGHKKRSRSDECGLFYVLKVVLIVAVDFEMLVISCGKRSTHGQPNMDSGVQFTSDILCNRLLKITCGTTDQGVSFLKNSS
ncbi:MAG: hypothetical protein PHI97_33910, partial [Desulfobulbus sp.]|nr:hypothetical protein [Desulfobulbus sp.]